MSIMLDTNSVYLKDRLSINTSRMNNYAERSVDEIITEESKQGNSVATNYGKDLFNNQDELINAFKLDDPNNKYQVINAMNDEEQAKVLPELESEDLVLGLNFFTQDKLLKLFEKVSPEEAVNVVLNVFSIEQVVQMLPEEYLEKFFFSDDVEKDVVLKQLKNMPNEILTQMIEGITGEPADESDSMALIKSISELPEKQYKETMANMDPVVQGQVVFQMAKDDKKILEVFDPSAYTGMLQQLQKPDMVKSMIGLEEKTLQNMITELPKELFSIVASQIDTKTLATLLMSDCQDVLERMGSR